MVLRFFGREYFIPTKYKVLIISFIILILIAMGFLIVSGRDSGKLEEIVATSSPTTIEETSEPSEDETTEVAETADTTTEIDSETDEEVHTGIFVYIIGEIASPDVYEIPEDAILKDLVDIAGGLTDKADLEAINLAYRLTNGMMIKIPSKSAEDKTWIIDTGTSSASAVTSDSIGSGTVKVNINTATVSELCTLPGIGESTALKIINYRTENGNFSDISEIMNVSGIKTAKYNDIKSYITVK